MSDLLRQTQGNPVPPGASAGMMTAFDGKQVRYALFPSRGKCGTVVVLPGRNECIEKYFETVGDLTKRGFAVAMLDWRGQGGSDRLLRDPRRGHVGSFDDYVADLDQFFREIVLPDCRPPYTILAHSTGGLIALLATPRLINRVRRVVLLSPLLEVKADLPLAPLKWFVRTLHVLGLGRLYAIGPSRRGKEVPFQPNALTSDPDRWARNQELLETHPELFVGGPTATWMNAAWNTVERVRDPDFRAAVKLPVLFIAAGGDRVVSTPAIERYAQGLRSARVLTIDGARHELLQEADFYREQVFAAFEAFACPPEEDEAGEEDAVVDGI
jgi:lysophospholipase